MTGPVRRGAYKALVVEHGEEQLGTTEPPPAAPEPAAEEHPARFGARDLDRAGRRAIAAAGAEEDRPTVRPWASSARAAVRALALVWDQGASLRSTCDPDRANRVQTSSDPSLGGREHDRIERVANVSRALDRAERDYPLALAEACGGLLTPSQARAVFEAREMGRARLDHVAQYGRKLKGTFLRRDPVPLPTVVELAREQLGVELQRRHVAAICAHFLGIVERDLVRSGEMREPARPIARRRGFAADPAARIRES